MYPAHTAVLPADAVPLPLPTGLPLAAPLALLVPFPFPVPSLSCFPVIGLAPWGLQAPSTVDIDTSNEGLSVFLQHTVLMSTEALNLEIQR